MGTLAHLIQHQHLPVLVLGLLRQAIWLVILCVMFVPLEWLFAVHPRKLANKSAPGDLGFYFISGIVPHVLSPQFGDFNDDLRRAGLPTLRATLVSQLRRADVQRFAEPALPAG